METWEWIALAAAAGVVLVLLVGAGVAVARRRRRGHLKERFGHEYERAVSETGKREAERRLSAVESRRDDLEIRPLPAPARDRYLDEWRLVEARFVSDPPDAVRAAERIVVRVLEERGYPVDGDVEEQTAFVAADYPGVAQHFRHAHDMISEAESSTESLRRAMVDFRAVLEELLARERAAV